ncbi:NAD(P)/FAD-dependent oxidoreductase [Limibacter armeniacum]|uniref:FAD-dependent oxidoreductase n=1 Tax=Limibacter armeniacum TaxID=466084 RepID=UPI002FE657EE
MEKIIITGAGLAGSLLAIMMAKRGFEVAVYERRPDMRKVDISAGRSINLALSDRGIAALQKVGLDEVILSKAIPMFGRLIHPISGELDLQPYSGRSNDYINSISRGELNKILLNAAESYPNLQLRFNVRCEGMDLETGTVRFVDELTHQHFSETADVTLAADGANSAIRNEMYHHAPKLRFTFSQNYLKHGYKELYIPPNKNGGFRMDQNALHIWPRKSYMLIALPNTDGSFTATLFMAFDGEDSFEKLDNPEAITSFFEKEFPDVIPHIPDLVENFQNHPASALATIKCYPWQVNGKALLIGDAAHAVVPFYGQGMNCAFEDCLILDKLIEELGPDWNLVLNTYQMMRKADTDAIGELAEENYYEMRDHVANPVYQKKKDLDLILEQNFENFDSKYSMVTFREDLPYSVAMRKGRAQDKLLTEICQQVNNIHSLDLHAVLEQVIQLHLKG